MDVSRRHFNFGIAGFLGALFMPKGSEAAVPEPEVASAASFNDHDHTPGYTGAGAGDVTLFGQVTSDPAVKSYIKSDRTDGTRAFFRMAVPSTHGKATTIVPIVAWGDRAAWCGRNLYKGDRIALVGSLHTDGDSSHIVLQRAETPRSSRHLSGERW